MALSTPSSVCASVFFVGGARGICCVIGDRGVPFGWRGGGEDEEGERRRSAQDLRGRGGAFGVEGGRREPGSRSEETVVAVVAGDWGVRMGEEWDEGGAVERAVVEGGVGATEVGVEGAGVLMRDEGAAAGVGAAIGEDGAGLGAGAGADAAVGMAVDATDSSAGMKEAAGTTGGGGAGGRDGGLSGDAAAVLGTTCGGAAGVEEVRVAAEMLEGAEDGRTNPGGGRVLGPKLRAGASEGGGGRGRRERGGV